VARVLRGREADRERAAVDEAADLVRGDDRGSAGEAVRLDRRSLLCPESTEPVARELDRLRADAFIARGRAAGDEWMARTRWPAERAVVADAVERRVGFCGGRRAESASRRRPAEVMERACDERGQKQRAEQPAMTAGEQIPIMNEPRSAR
jgi:hypothetical protein